MEQRSKYVASINLESAAPPSASMLAAALCLRKEYGVSVCDNRVYSLLLTPGSAAYPRPLDKQPRGVIQSALVTGGSRVRQKSGGRMGLWSSFVCAVVANLSHTFLLILPTQGLGLEYCRELVCQGCRLILVASRSGGLAVETMAEFACMGCTVLAVRLDSSIAASLAEVLEWAHTELPFVEHFAHAAGVPGFALLEDITPGQFHAVADVKVRCEGQVCTNCGGNSTMCATQYHLAADTHVGIPCAD